MPHFARDPWSLDDIGLPLGTDEACSYDISQESHTNLKAYIHATRPKSLPRRREGLRPACEEGESGNGSADVFFSAAMSGRHNSEEASSDAAQSELEASFSAAISACRKDPLSNRSSASLSRENAMQCLSPAGGPLSIVQPLSCRPAGDEEDMEESGWDAVFSSDEADAPTCNSLARLGFEIGGLRPPIRPNEASEFFETEDVETGREFTFLRLPNVLDESSKNADEHVQFLETESTSDGFPLWGMTPQTSSGVESSCDERSPNTASKIFATEFSCAEPPQAPAAQEANESPQTAQQANGMLEEKTGQGMQADCFESQYLSDLQQNRAQERRGLALDRSWTCLDRRARHAWPSRRTRGSSASSSGLSSRKLQQLSAKVEALRSLEHEQLANTMLRG